MHRRQLSFFGSLCSVRLLAFTPLPCSRSSSDGPTVYRHDYFTQQQWDKKMDEVWDDNFGFLQEVHGSAIVMNMVGSGEKSDDETWRDVALRYARDKGFGIFYYRLNPVRARIA